MPRIRLSLILIIMLVMPLASLSSPAHGATLSVQLNIQPYSLLYEGDLVNCTAIGTPTERYWQINSQSHHTLFYGNDPVLFDPEPTPLNDTYVTLTVTFVNGTQTASDSVPIKLARLYFGDLQFHSLVSDGRYQPSTLYQHAIDDNYLDFAALTDHAELMNSIDITPPQPVLVWFKTLAQYLAYRYLDRDEWQIDKDAVQQYNRPGDFTTLLAFEWSSGPWFTGGSPLSPNGHEDVGHICFFYRDVYPNAPKYSAWDHLMFDDILGAMKTLRDEGLMNVGFPHHPLMKIGPLGDYTVNWTFLATKLTNATARNEILRGVETYSRWGTAIGNYSGIPVEFPYGSDQIRDNPTYWVENGLWEWSKDTMKGDLFALMGGSDTHLASRPGSAILGPDKMSKTNPSGITAAYAIHNTRGEIWDALNNSTIYADQCLKIRANVRFNNQMALGRWINCTSPLEIRVSVYSTFPGNDSAGQSMCPNGYEAGKLQYPVQDIWLVKKDTARGQPWCKVIGHVSPNSSLATVTFTDDTVQPNDFYYVAIRQQGENLTDSMSGTHGYMAFLGPVFIDSVQS
jgi:hypothetical protein